MFLIIAAFTFVITNVARILHCVSAAVSTFAMATLIEAFLMGAGVLARIRHAVGSTFVRRALSKDDGFSVSLATANSYRCSGRTRAAS